MGASILGPRGIFKLVDTKGFSLEILLLELRDKNLLMDWGDFIMDAKKHGWTNKTIRKKIKDAVRNAFGQQYMDDGFTKVFDEFMESSNTLLPDPPKQKNVLDSPR